MREELGLDVVLECSLGTVNGEAFYLTHVDGEPPLRLTGPERCRPALLDGYRPRWVPIAELPRLRLRNASALPLLPRR